MQCLQEALVSATNGEAAGQQALLDDVQALAHGELLQLPLRGAIVRTAHFATQTCVQHMQLNIFDSPSS